MRSYSQVFVPGETKDYYIDAKFFFLFGANAPVSVQLWKNGAPSDDLALNVLAGFKVKPKGGFDRVSITSSAAQTIDFFITAGEGDYDRTLGSVNIIGNLQGITNTVNTVNSGQSYGASYRSGNLLAANTPEVVFPPAANVNGAIIHAAMFASAKDSTTWNLFGFLAKSSAPISVTDGDCILGVDGVNVFTGNNWEFGSLKNPLKVPAGKGLYAISGAIETGGSIRNVLYTLL